MALPVLQPAYVHQASSIYASQYYQASTPSSPRTPSPEYVAGRLHCIANNKLRIESSHNEPNLRRLLGHIFVYDAIREHQQLQLVHTSATTSRRREQQLRRQQQSEAARRNPSKESSSSSSTNTKDIEAYLATLPSPNIPPAQAQAFVAFQNAIASQLDTLSQQRLDAASRQLHDTRMHQAEAYYSDDEDDNNSDYDSYDGDESNWRFDDEDDLTAGEGDSDTDPESAISEPPSPTTEEPSPECSKSGSYFLPVRTNPL